MLSLTTARSSRVPLPVVVGGAVGSSGVSFHVGGDVVAH